MSKQKQNTLIATQTKKLRESAALSMDSLALLTGLSKATISRLENGLDFRISIAEKIAGVLGWTVRQFEDTDVQSVPEATLDRKIDEYIAINEIKDPHLFLAKSRKSMRGPTHYVQKLIDRKYFREKRTMGAIVSFIEKEYEVTIKGSLLTNALKVRPEIEITSTGKSIHHYYQFTKGYLDEDSKK